MKKFLLLFSSMFVIGLAYGQTSNGSSAALKNQQAFTNVMNPAQANGNMKPGSMIFTAPPKREDRKGSPYLYDSWNTGVIHIKSLDKAYKFESMKFDMMHNDIELKIDGQVKVLPNKEVQEFTLQNGNAGTLMHFIRLDGFTYENVPLVGFCQILAQGKVTLVEHHFTEIKEANFNAALNIGDKFDTILKKSKYYFVYKNKLYPANNKKNISKFYSELGVNTKKYLKENDIDIKTDVGLTTLVNNFNKKK